MVVSVAEGLRMMQGGVDRTGFADMAEGLGNPGMDLIRERRAAAAEEAAMTAALEEYEKRQAKSDQEFMDLFESLLPPEEKLEEEPLGLIPSIIDSITPEQTFEIDPDYKRPRIQGPGRGVQGMKDGGEPKKPKSTYEKIKDYVVVPSGFYSLADFLAQGLGYPGLFNEGGRVEMQLGGGLMNNLLGQPGVQQALQNQIYQQPTFDFQPMPSPNPGLGMPPAPATAQAYNPFVSTMPLYDPSTLGTGLPSTAGMTDPYFSYDPYSPVGAFDAPSSPSVGLLTQDKIDETFKDLDKFSLRAQEAKRKAAEEAAKKKETRRGGRGEGKAQRDKFVADRAKREANAKIGTLDRNLRGDKPGSMGPGGGKSCFVKGTMLQMADGTEKEISTVELGDNTKGGIVEMTMQGLPQTIYNYKGVLVSGSHWVIEDNEFVAVEDSKHGVLTDKVEPVYTLKTSEHRMWINDIEFGDFETGSDDDWEPHFEAVRKKLNEELRSGHI